MYILCVCRQVINDLNTMILHKRVVSSDCFGTNSVYPAPAARVLQLV
jgi:hypothetical protein